MARSPDTATTPTSAEASAQAPAPELPTPVVGASKTALAVCRRCMEWTQQAEAAHAETLRGMEAALTSALAAMDHASRWDDVGSVATNLWRASFDELRRRQSDLPFSLMSMQLEVMRSLMDEAMAEARVPAQVATGGLGGGLDAGRAYAQTQEAFDAWMRQWAGWWPTASGRSLQVA